MCGIAGIIDTSRRQGMDKALLEMVNAQKHRGPDAEGTFRHDNVYLGHRRLSIIDLDKKANQPMSSSDGRYTIVFNGEIYNYRELRNKLSGYDFKTESDTEVLLALFVTKGVQAFHELNGMFACAIFDKDKNEVTIVRDRLGIKPLYYAHDDSGVVFASELRAILRSGLVRKSLNKGALSDYLRYQTVHAPQTIVQDVRMLMPGHYMVISDNEIKEYRWWSPEEAEIRADDEQTTKQTIRNLLLDGVEKRMVSDVPIGAFLSGGIDSSTVVGLMSEVATGKINTYSVVFEEQEFSEAPYAQQVANKFGTDHHEILLHPRDLLNQIPDALKSMDHPSGDGVNTYVVSGETRKSGVKVALSGLGGDELFAGYDIFKFSREIESKKWVLSFPKYVRRLGGKALVKMKGNVQAEKYLSMLELDYFEPEYYYPIFRQLFPDRMVKGLLSGEDIEKNRVFEIGELVVGEGAEGFELPTLSKISSLEINTYLQNVLLRDTDQMSMAHALEVRVPFLDHRLVEYVMGVQDQLKFPHSPKKLLTDSLEGLLPEDIMHRPKMGFVLPWEHWMRNELRDMTEASINGLARREIISQKALNSLWKRFESGDKRVTWSRIWPLVVLETWMNNNGVD